MMGIPTYSNKIFALAKSLFEDKFSQQFVSEYIYNKFGVRVLGVALTQMELRYTKRKHRKKGE